MCMAIRACSYVVYLHPYRIGQNRGLCLQRRSAAAVPRISLCYIFHMHPVPLGQSILSEKKERKTELWFLCYGQRHTLGSAAREALKLCFHSFQFS